MVLFKRDPTLEVGALSTEDTDLAALGAIFWDIKFQLCVAFAMLFLAPGLVIQLHIIM